MYPIFVTDNNIENLEIRYATKGNENNNKNDKVYFKLSYIGTFSNLTKIKLEQTYNKY